MRTGSGTLGGRRGTVGRERRARAGRRIAAWLLLPLLLIGPSAAQEEDPTAAPAEAADAETAPADDAAGDAAPSEEAGEESSEGSEQSEKRRKRKEKRRRRAAEEESAAGEAAAASAEGDDREETSAAPDGEETDGDAEGSGAAAGDDGDDGDGGDDGDDENEADDEDDDRDEPVLLRLTTDEPCLVMVDGKVEGTLQPDGELEVGVDLGEIVVRATGTDVPQAIFEKTLELEEPGEESVRIRMGRAIRQLRKRERKEGIFRDPKRGLMWPKRDSGRDLDWRAAGEYCETLRTGGFEDWRLPTLREIESLNAIWQRTGYKILGGILLTDCCVWTSDREGDRAWTWDFRSRRDYPTNIGYELGLRALCVHVWAPEEDEEAEASEETDGPDDDADD